MKITSLLCAAMTSVIGVSYATSSIQSYPTAVNNVITLSVPEGDEITYTGSLGSTVTSLVKTGLGKAILQEASDDFTGSITVSQGILAPLVPTAIGGKDADHVNSITVSSGATLDVSAFSAAPWCFYHEMTLSGSGASGTKGAFVFDRTTLAGSNNDFMRTFKMTDDTTIYIAVGGNVGIRNRADSWWGTQDVQNMNGKKLTINGSGTLVTHGVRWQNGTLRFEGAICYMMESTGRFLSGGMSPNLLQWASTGSMGFPGMPDMTGDGWKIVGEKSLAFKLSSVAAMTWAGEIEMAADAEFKPTASISGDKKNALTLSGKISGGKLVKYGTSVTQVTSPAITNLEISTADSHRGLFKLTGGKYETGHVHATPYGNLWMENATLCATSSVWASTAARLTLTNVTGEISTLCAYYSGLTELVDSNIKAMCLEARGDGQFRTGTLPTNRLASSTIEMMVPESFTTRGSRQQCRVRGEAVLVITNTTITAPLQDYGSYTGKSFVNFTVPQDEGAKFGVLRIEDGSTLTGIGLNLNAKNGYGAAVQKGGSTEWHSIGWIGAGSAVIGDSEEGRGCYFMDGGTCTFKEGVVFGNASPTSRGWYVQRGGETRFASTWYGNFHFGKNGYAELYVGGGDMVFSGSGGTQLCSINEVGETSKPESVFTFANTGTVVHASEWLASWRTNRSVSVFNFNSGAAVRTKSVRRRSDNVAEVYWNLNGGVFQPLYQTTGYGDICDEVSPNKVTLYDGGVVFDTSYATNTAGERCDRQILAPIRRATGKGIKSITLPAEYLALKVPGPTRIHISGAGSGATALVDYDTEALVARGVIVTCPGTDYDETTVIEVEGLKTTDARFTCTYELADNAGTGSVVKRGEGKFSMPAACDIGGALVIEDGTLGFAGDVAISNRVVMSCDAAFGGGLLTASGTIDLTEATFEISDPENLEGYVDATNTVVISAANVVGCPKLAADYGRFTVRATSKGIKFGPTRGMVLMFR